MTDEEERAIVAELYALGYRQIGNLTWTADETPDEERRRRARELVSRLYDEPDALPGARVKG